MTETAIKTKIRRYLKDKGYFIPYSPHFGRSGVPDILGCMKGRFIAIEVKTTKGKLTRLQEHELRLITENGGKAMVVWGWDDFIYKFNNLTEV